MTRLDLIWVLCLILRAVSSEEAAKRVVVTRAGTWARQYGERLLCAGDYIFANVSDVFGLDDFAMSTIRELYWDMTDRGPSIIRAALIASAVWVLMAAVCIVGVAWLIHGWLGW
jgi:hypothetical protein